MSFTDCGSHGYMLERRSSFGLSMEPAASTTVPAREIANLAGQRVAGDELEMAAVVLHVLDEMVQQELQARTIPVVHAGRQAEPG